MAKTLSRAAKEPASLWLARISRFQQAWDEGSAERDKYRRAVRLDLEPRGMDATYLPTGQMRVHLPHRIHAWFQSQAYDKDIEVRYPRDATGDADYAPMVEKVSTRVFNDADGVRAFRRGLTDLLTDGCFAVWYGLPNELTASDAEWVNIAPEDAFEAAIEGTHMARPGQDHLMLAQHLLTMALDEEGMARWTPEQRMQVFGAARDHAKMAEADARVPRDWTADRGRVWIRHYQVGEACAWDTTVSDVEECFWMAYRVSMSLDRAQTHPSFDPSARKLIRGKVLGDRTPATDVSGQELLREIRTEDMDRDLVERENQRANVWVIHDRRHGTRHLIPEVVSEGESFYLEVDERDPYWNADTGRSVIPGGFPCEVCAPHQSNERSVKRTFGIPGLRAGWPFIISIQNYEAAIDDMVKRIKRVFVFSPDWPKKRREMVANGEDGTCVIAPASAAKADPRNLGIRTVEFPDVSEQLLRERDRKLTYLSIVSGIPRSALVGEAVAETLGQEEIAEASASSQTGDIVGQVARTMARVIHGVMMLVRKFYDTSDVAHIIGEDAMSPVDPNTGETLRDPVTGRAQPSKWDEWVMSSVEGDIPRVELAATSASANPRRVLQLQQFAKTNREVLNIRTGLPHKDDAIIIDEIARALGVGDLPDLDVSPEQLLQMAIQRDPALVSAFMQGGGAGGGRGPSDSPASPRAPTENEEGTGARRSAPVSQPQNVGKAP